MIIILIAAAVAIGIIGSIGIAAGTAVEMINRLTPWVIGIVAIAILKVVISRELKKTAGPEYNEERRGRYHE